MVKNKKRGLSMLLYVTYFSSWIILMQSAVSK